jgi:hypothetical protein
MNNKKLIQYLSLICFFLGATGIFLSSRCSTYENSKIIFMLSSFLLGLSILILLHRPTLQANENDFLTPTLLFLVAIIKVIGIHTKYGLYLGCDSVEEFDVIKYMYFNSHFLITSNSLSEFPLPYIYVYITSTILNVDPLSGSWNLVHLVTNALTVAFLYLLIKRIFNQKVAIISCIAYMYNPAVSIYSLSMTRENFGVLFLAALLSIMQIQSEKRKNSNTILYIIICISLILSHYTTSYYSLFTIILLFCSGYFLTVLRKKNPDKPFYGEFYLLFFLIFLFIWIFYITYHHQNDIRIADQMLKGIKDLFEIKEPVISSSRETTKIFFDYSLVQNLYKVQAAFLVFGSLYLSFKIRKLPKGQKIFALSPPVHTLIIALSSFVPALAEGLSPTRIMRFGIVIACSTVGYIFYHASLFKPDVKKICISISILILLLTFVYPISSWIANEYMAFSPQPYPYQLGPEMYNIKSTHEIYELGQINKMLPKKSTIALEFPLVAEMFYQDTVSLHPDNTESLISKIHFNDTVLFENTTNNYDSKNYIFLRKSLFQNKQYIFMPDNWISTSTYLKTINDMQLELLNNKIENNNLVYNEGSYKLLNLKNNL